MEQFVGHWHEQFTGYRRARLKWESSKISHVRRLDAGTWRTKVEVDELREAIDAYRNATLLQTYLYDSGRHHTEYSARQLLVGNQRNSPAPLAWFSVFRDIIPTLNRPDRGASWSPKMDVTGIFEWLHEVRHRKSIRHDLELEAAGELKAKQRLLRTVQDFWCLQAGSRLKLPKGDPDHWTVMKIGRELGLSTLSPKELAACFDELCPCGSKRHSPEYLTKLRRKVIREFQVDGI